MNNERLLNIESIPVDWVPTGVNTFISFYSGFFLPVNPGKTKMILNSMVS